MRIAILEREIEACGEWEGVHPPEPGMTYHAAVWFELSREETDGRRATIQGRLLQR